MASKLVKQPDGTYRWVEREGSQSRAQKARAVGEMLQAEIESGAVSAGEANKQYGEQMKNIGYSWGVAKPSPIAPEKRQRTPVENKGIYQFKDNVTQNVQTKETETPKTLQDFGGSVPKWSAYLRERAKSGERTPFDFDNPAGAKLTSQQVSTINKMNEKQQEQNKATGGVGGNLTSSYYNNIVQGEASRQDVTQGLPQQSQNQTDYANDTSRQDVTQGLLQQSQNQIDYANDISNFMDDEGNIDYAAWTSALQQAIRQKQETEQSIFEMAGAEAQSTLDEAGIDMTPPTMPDYLTEQDLKTSLLGQQILESQEEEMSMLEEEQARQKRQFEETQQARLRQEQEKQRRLDAAVAMQTGGLQGMVANSSFAAGVIMEGRNYLDKLKKSQEIELSDFISQQDSIRAQLDSENQKVFDDWLTEERKARKDEFDNQMEVWKELNNQRWEAYKEERQKEKLEIDKQAEKRLQQGEDRQQDRFQFDVDKYWQDRDDQAKKEFFDDVYKLLKDTNGKMAAGAVAEYFAEQGVRFDPMLLMEAMGKEGLLERMASDPYLAKAWAEAPQEVRSFTMQLQDEEDRIRLEAFSKQIQSSSIGKGTGTATSKGNKLTSTDEKSLIQAGVEINGRTRYSDFSRDELLKINKEEEVDRLTKYQEEILIPNASLNNALKISQALEYGDIPEEFEDAARKIMQQEMEKAMRQESKPGGIFDMFGGFSGGGTKTTTTKKEDKSLSELLDSL